MRACVHACVHVCVCACVCMCACACLQVYLEDAWQGGGGNGWFCGEVTCLIKHTSLMGTVAKSFPSPMVTDRHRLLGRLDWDGCSTPSSCDMGGDASSSSSLSESAHKPSTKSVSKRNQSICTLHHRGGGGGGEVGGGTPRCTQWPNVSSSIFFQFSWWSSIKVHVHHVLNER